MTPSVETRLRAVEDEVAIRALAARFSDYANERDYDGFADLWSARGVWEIGPPLHARAEGVDAIIAMLRRLLAPKAGFMQMIHSGIVRLDGDRAAARFVEREHGRGEPSFYENQAVYEDELVRELDGRWRFLRRTYIYRFLDESRFGGKVFPVTACGAGVTRNGKDPT